jgi:tetratricopeptide (TPR) repeat protein
LELSKESPTITKDERDFIYFNRSILYLYIGENIQSFNNLNKIKQHLINPLEIEYMKILISFLDDGRVDEIRETLLSLRERLQQSGDKDGILRGWALTIYTVVISYPNSVLVEKLSDSFFHDLNMIGEIAEYKEKSLALFQLGISLCLNLSSHSTIIKELLMKTKPLLAQVEDHLLLARNNYLEGQFYNKHLHDPSTALTFFKRALESLNTNYEGIFKADILYEISKFMKCDNEAMEALELYRGQVKDQFIFTHFHELVLPAFKY